MLRDRWAMLRTPGDGCTIDPRLERIDDVTSAKQPPSPFKRFVNTLRSNRSRVRQHLLWR